MIPLTAQQIDAVAASGDNPPTLFDPHTRITYVLLRTDAYEAMTAASKADVTSSTDGDQEHEHARQKEIETLRARHQDEFERIENVSPSLDELLSMTIEPPGQWLEER